MKLLSRFVLLSAVFGLASCSEKLAVDTGTSMTDISVTVEVGEGLSKAVSVGSENEVKTLQVVMFRDGVLYSSSSASGNSLSMKVGIGTYECFAFVNDPVDWSGDSSLTQEKIMSSVSRLASNSMSSFVMFGHKEVTVSSLTESAVIPVDRFVSKVELRKITVDLDDNVIHDGSTLLVKGIYLTNVLGTCPYSMEPSVTPSAFDEWYSKMKLESLLADVASMTSETGLSVSIPDNSTEFVDRCFYSYPNASFADTDSDAWAPRRTRLVIEAVLGGKNCFYHVTLPQMYPNHSYLINECKIKNMGGISPEKNLESASLEVSMTVVDWRTGFSKDVVIDF